jgi:hypothetical protein
VIPSQPAATGEPAERRAQLRERGAMELATFAVKAAPAFAAEQARVREEERRATAQAQREAHARRAAVDRACAVWRTLDAIARAELEARVRGCGGDADAAVSCHAASPRPTFA